MQNSSPTSTRDSVLAGVAGAVVLTLVHQGARLLTSKAPRMDILGRRVLKRGYEAAGSEPPPEDRLQRQALTGDLVANSAYYALVGLGGTRHPWVRGSSLGTLAGIGAVVLPTLMGLGQAPQDRTSTTRALTFSWYLLGGLAAAGALQLLNTGTPRRP